MSYDSYNLDKQELIDSYNKAYQNINNVNPDETKYNNFLTIQEETKHILKKEHTIFIVTSTATVLLIVFTLQTILK